MFDIGFWELTIIGIVALLVIGPERLPRVARTAGLWVGRARRFVSSVKADIDRELAADELKKALGKQAQTPGIYDIIEDTKKSLREIEDAATEQPQGKQAETRESAPELSHEAEQDKPESVTDQPHSDKGAPAQKPNDASG